MRLVRSLFPALLTAALSAVALLAAPSPAASAVPPQPASADTAAFRLKIAEVLAQVSEIRELDPRRPVEPKLESREDLAAYVGRQFEREDNAERLRAEGRMLETLGLLPQGYSLPDSLLAIYREQIGGVYDYHSKRLLMAAWLAPELQTSVMAHELVHALQDQRYGIGDRLDSLLAEGDDDETQAYLALVEGDATAVMLDVAAGSLGMALADLQEATALLPKLIEKMSGSAPRLAAAPRAVQQSLLFPYVQGTAFVLAVHRKIAWSDFARVYARPPLSSADILHPDLYLAGSLPRARVRWSEDLTDPDRPGRDESTFGEWGLRLVLARVLPDSTAESGAAGWVGDRALLLGLDSAWSTLFLATAWRDDAEADEFYRDLVDIYFPSTRDGTGDVADGPDGGVVRVRAGKEMNWAERRGSLVVLALGDRRLERAAADERSEQVFRSITVEAER
jgi:hypothetical protein